MITVGEGRDIEITAYREEYAGDFARLNLEWLEGSGLIEEIDRKYLEDPKTYVLAGGGEIFFAIEKGEVIGTCAAIRHTQEEIELAKLAVKPVAQGRGLGRRLSEKVLAFARAAGVKKVTLVSSTKLAAAVRLYESLGFQHAQMPADVGYLTADVYMELELE